METIIECIEGVRKMVRNNVRKMVRNNVRKMVRNNVRKMVRNNVRKIETCFRNLKKLTGCPNTVVFFLKHFAGFEPTTNSICAERLTATPAVLASAKLYRVYIQFS